MACGGGGDACASWLAHYLLPSGHCLNPCAPHQHFSGLRRTACVHRSRHVGCRRLIVCGFPSRAILSTSPLVLRPAHQLRLGVTRNRKQLASEGCQVVCLYACCDALRVRVLSPDVARHQRESFEHSYAMIMVHEHLAASMIDRRSLRHVEDLVTCQIHS